MRTFPVTLVALAMLAPLATADECSPELIVGTPDGNYYAVDNDLCQPACLFSIWVYADDDPDPCDPDDKPSTIVF